MPKFSQVRRHSQSLFKVAERRSPFAAEFGVVIRFDTGRAYDDEPTVRSIDRNLEALLPM